VKKLFSAIGINANLVGGARGYSEHAETNEKDLCPVKSPETSYN
jgi:hypothetical protein